MFPAKKLHGTVIQWSVPVNATVVPAELLAYN
jgi:hypothetical protein